jgi:2-desacetyl-2-hydroxyethyl bacteriochlorophyllide A dehydrogenase
VLTKRARLVGKGQFLIETVPFPPVNGNPVIQVTHVGICGSDVHHWEEGTAVEEGGLVLGHEYAGVVVDPGKSGLAKGDRVVGYTQNPLKEACGWCENCLAGDFEHCTNRVVKVALGCEPEHPGAYSQYVTWYPSAVYKLPDNVSSEEAAMIEPAAVGLHAVGLSEIRPGAKVLIIGGGIIGLCVAEWARVFGAEKIIMTDLNHKKLEKIRSFGLVDKALEADDPDLRAKLAAEAPEGYDLFFDCVTVEKPLNMAIGLLKRGGTGVLVGVNFHPVSVDLFETVVFQKRLQGSKGHTPEDFKAVLRAIAAGKLDMKKYVSRKVSLEDIQTVFGEIKRTGDDIKVLIEF